MLVTYKGGQYKVNEKSLQYHPIIVNYIAVQNAKNLNRKKFVILALLENNEMVKELLQLNESQLISELKKINEIDLDRKNTMGNLYPFTVK